MSEPNLAKYTFQDDFISRRLDDKKTREDVRKQSDTDPELIEKHRRDIGVLLNDARKSLTIIYKHFNRAESLYAQIQDGESQLAKASEDERAHIESEVTTARDELRSIEAQLRARMQFALLVNSFCQSYSLTTILDSITVRDEYPREVVDRETGEKKTKWRSTRYSLCGLLYELFMGDDEEDVPEGEAAFPGIRTVLAEMPTATQVETLGKLFHDAETSRFLNMISQVNASSERRGVKPHELKAPFAETRKDENDVEVFVEDWYAEAVARMQAEYERRRDAAQRSRDESRGGMDREEAESVEREGLDGILNREGKL